VTPSQIALSWVLSKGNDMFPIPGTKRIKYLDENIEATTISLEKDEIDQLDQLYKLVSGNRY
jgi:aryl-alcohol dehydrogenase-like predicted oxidoreductase